MVNKKIHIYIILILSGCYITYFAKVRSSEVQNTIVPVLIPNYSPEFYSEKNPPVRFQWHKVETVDSFLIQADFIDSFPNPFIYWGISDTFFNGNIFLNPGTNSVDTIYWRVRVETGKDKNTITPWAVSSVVFINSKVPVFIPHENPTHIRRPTLKWHPPQVISSRCILKVYKDTNHLYTLPIEPEDTSYTFVEDTLPIGTIYWKLEYDDPISSPIQSITIVPGHTPIPSDFNVTNLTKPEFSWKKTTETESYTFELDDDLNFSSPIISTPVSSTLYLPYKDISDIKKKYYWRVRSNETLIWSSVHEFSIDTVPLLHKFNGELYNNPLPTFEWDEVKSSNQYIYRIQIADNHFFKPSFIDEDVGEKTSFTPLSHLSKETIFFWRVGYSLKDEVNFIYTKYDSIKINYTITGTKQLSNIKKPKFHFFSSQKLISFSSKSKKDHILGLYIYNLKGKNIHSIISNSTHKNKVEWDYSFGKGKLVPSGMYLIKIVSEREVFKKKILYYSQ